MAPGWTGRYHDGRTATGETVGITIAAEWLAIERPDGTARRWLYEDVRQTLGVHRHEPVRLEHGDDPAESLVVEQPGFLAAVHAAAPDAARHLAHPGRRARRAWFIAAGTAAAATLGAVLYLWGIPALADRVAARVPVSWEEDLGRTVADQLAADLGRCADTAAAGALERIVARLADAQPSPYTYRVTLTNSDMVNAFAAPGGYIVVTRGLLAHAGRPEELAGVLAHEMQHVERRHGTRAVLRQVPTRLLLGAVTGELGGLGGAVNAIGTLGVLRYQRQDEEEADREGLALMRRAAVDPTGMVDFFQTLRREAADVPAALSYLSTHPRTDARIARLREQAAAFTGARPLVTGVDWERVRTACGGSGG